MSLIPGEPLQYAETHFKFKLPWSLLYRPWPEILVDAPFQFVPGSRPTLWIVVRDAHRFPVVIENIEIDCQPATAQDESAPRQQNLQIEANQQFGFYPVDLGDLAPGTYSIHCKVAVHSKQNGKVKKFSRWNHPLLKPAPLKIRVLAQDLPKPEGYIAGEMHCHTHYSADHVEHGATPAVFQQAAKAVGLDFVSLTDHAYDFAFLTEDYTQAAPSPMPRFEALQKEVDLCNRAEDKPLMIAGEEVSAGNSKGENVHMTVLGSDCYLPGLGDCGRNWLQNRPTLKIPDLLKMTGSHCFAAHPYQEMSGLEKFIFRRGFWHSVDLQTGSTHPIRGIQFWNGIRDEGFKLGREWWIQELGKENYLLPIGGNDAHGDMNDTTAVRLPLIELKNNRHHVFGYVRTVVRLAQKPCENPTSAEENIPQADGCHKEQPLTLDDVNAAFCGDNCYITDGPALWWERVTDRGESAVTFHARSTPETGEAFRYVRIYGRRRLLNGKLAPKEELHLASQVAARPATDITVPFEDFAYLRAECLTSCYKYALTSAAIHKKNI
ncbi:MULTISPECIES: PHP domain-containing protein [unclassified Fibrobacter]|uniref:PHP domain-containing protein n=1 Tax=unclassified Fibrobacter TaxID=2634177 RepID=UPI000914DAA5|nr:MULTISPECIES: PHP domain-containing protein [unclassified Fibrobacter]OWV05769.1 hypothetical protein B7993_07675 [Fibrobacter sp. UWH3]SHK17011.1 hypothetical protein SAMN05720765_101102 [Fibrobacter sp. UWH6]